MNNEKNRWTSDVVFEKNKGVKFPPSFPNEMLVKLCSSKSYSDLTSSLFKKSIKVCELGSFSGNNTRFFLEKGYDVHCVEINNDMINLGRDNLKRLGYPISNIFFNQGDNLNIPYDENTFDLFVSINTIHYNYGLDIERAFFEYSRVVKKGGVVVIETPAQKHSAYKAANRVGMLDYIWAAGDFRDGQHFGFFESKEHFESLLKKYFSKVEIHYRYEKTQKTELEWNIAVCKV
jgi:ubiquinone/menaquinone biosynthesis C-methylase UbiE